MLDKNDGLDAVYRASGLVHWHLAAGSRVSESLARGMTAILVNGRYTSIGLSGSSRHKSGLGRYDVRDMGYRLEAGTC
jgi:hypothetical protein